MKEELREIVENNTTRKGRIFDYFIQTLILISLLSFAFETIPDNSEELKQILRVIDIISVSIFTIEYILRIYVSRRPLSYIFSFYGIVDFLAIMPFYLRISIDLRALRSFRVFRIFRALKVVRYNRALRRFHIATSLVKEEFFLFILVTLLLIFISASGIYFFEYEAQPEVFKSVFHSLWWAIITITTVGYGDVYPITVGGQIFTFFVVFIGVGVVTIPAGLIASALSKARVLEQEEVDKKNLE